MTCGLPSTSIYVINLDSSTERLAGARAQLDSAGLAFERIPGVDLRGRDLATIAEYDREGTLAWLHRELMVGEIGCYLSHLRALKAFLDSSDDYALILEDDFVFYDHSIALIREFLTTAGEIRGGFSVANLGRRAKSLLRKIKTIKAAGSTTEVFRAYYPALGAYAQIWSRQGAEEVFPQSQTIVAPIDDWFRHLTAGTGKALTFSSEVVTTSDGMSEIVRDEQDMRRFWRQVSPDGFKQYKQSCAPIKRRAQLRYLLSYSGLV